jgi:hypothetical protein
MTEDKDLYRFDLVFDGELVEHSADAFDVANTIIALTTATREMVRIKYGDDASKQVSLNVNAFNEGSLKTQFLLLITDPSTAAPTLLVTAGAGLKAYKTGKEALGMVTDYIKVRKWLRGKKPDKIDVSPGGDTYNIYADNSVINIGKDSFKALQDKTVQRNMDKIVEPLEKPGSELESLSIMTGDDDEPLISISKAEAKYVKSGDEELQVIDKMRLKGVVTKVDTKVRSGYINLGNMTSKRVSFTYPKNLPQDEFDILILSLRTRVQIYAIGTVDMDMEGHPCAIDISSIEDDEKLL